MKKIVEAEARRMESFLLSMMDVAAACCRTNFHRLGWLPLYSQRIPHRKDKKAVLVMITTGESLEPNPDVSSSDEADKERD